jgi:hypothetical protein
MYICTFYDPHAVCFPTMPSASSTNRVSTACRVLDSLNRASRTHMLRISEERKTTTFFFEVKNDHCLIAVYAKMKKRVQTGPPRKSQCKQNHRLVRPLYRPHQTGLINLRSPSCLPQTHVCLSSLQSLSGTASSWDQSLRWSFLGQIRIAQIIPVGFV